MQHRDDARKQALANAIESAMQDKSELELIIKATGRREDVARQLERIGKVRRFYGLIPYISLRCGFDYAGILVKATSGDVEDSVFERTFRRIIPEISRIDASSTITIHGVSAILLEKTKAALWNLDAIGAYEAQHYGSGEGVSVAVADTGIDYTHSQLRDRFGSDKGHDFVKDDGKPFDENGHGTHVAGIIASSGYGVAPSSRLYSVRVLDGNGSGSEADLIAGIEWCIQNGIDIVNMSLGSPAASSALEDICTYAWQRGMILVAAAGNNGYGANYPAAFGDSVIAVAAVDEASNRPDFSAIYETNDIAAPGVKINSTYPGEQYANLTGTSMASPHVAGALSLIMSITGGNEMLEEQMKEKARRLGKPEEFGAGLVRVDRMAESLQSGYAGASLLPRYLRLEHAAGNALKRFTGEAAAEMKRWLP